MAIVLAVVVVALGTLNWAAGYAFVGLMLFFAALAAALTVLGILLARLRSATAVAMIGFLAVVPGAALGLADTIGEHVEEPALYVVKPLKVLPGPQDTSLHIGASVEACDSATAEVVDVSVRETDTEVVIDAGVRIDGNGFFCEIRSAQDDFTVELARPLGGRRVIDDSRGGRSVIWSPERRQEALARLSVTRSDAERFLRSRFPGGDKVICDRRSPLFMCTLHAPSLGRRVEFWVEVGRGGKRLKALAAHYPAVTAREALTAPCGEVTAGQAAWRGGRGAPCRARAPLPFEASLPLRAKARAPAPGCRADIGADAVVPGH